MGIYQLGGCEKGLVHGGKEDTPLYNDAAQTPPEALRAAMPQAFLGVDAPVTSR